MISGLTACNKELRETAAPTVSDGEFVICASLPQSDGTKTTLDESGGKLLWAQYDRLEVFAGNGGATGSAFSLTQGEGSQYGNFSGTLDTSEMGADDYVYAIYPFFPGYNSIEGDTFRTPLTNGYYDFDFEGKECVGAELIPHWLALEGQSFPMVARSKDNKFQFYNICGGLKVTVSHENLIAVIIKNNDGGPLWGVMEYTLDADGKPEFQKMIVPDELDGYLMDEVWLNDAGTNYDYYLVPGEPYYLSLPPVTFTQGMTVTYRTPSTSATYEVSGPFDIRRNVFSRLTNRDAALEFKPLEGNIEFSCDALKQYLVQHYDSNGDGEISYAEALDVKEIIVHDAGGLGNPARDYDLIYMENLETFVWTGTEDNPGSLNELRTEWWPKLQYLDCRNNSVSRNVYFYNNPDVETIILQHNQIPSISLGELPKLKTLALSYNSISKIDLGGCPGLDNLYLAYNSLGPDSLDLSANTNLTFLNCNSNSLESLDVSPCTKLNYLACPNNAISSLELGDRPLLETLYCYHNRLDRLDVSGCPSLHLLSCYQNKLTSIDLSANKALTAAYVSYNPLGTIDVSKNAALEVLYCCMNDLSTLDVSANSALTNLRCFGNKLESLDLSHNPVLNEIVFGDNPMTELDVSHNPKLYYFDAVYAEEWFGEWESYNVMPTTYTSPLLYLYIADGQEIPEVTYGRLDATIPYATIVRTRNASGHPHADVFGDYTMKASSDISTDSQGNLVRHDFEWVVNATEYDGDVTRVWLNPMCYLASAYPDSFGTGGRIYAIVRGDGKGFRIPLPQKTGILNDGIFSFRGGYMYYYVWKDDITQTGGYHFQTDEDVVEFIAQPDGSLIANKSFGMAIDRVEYDMYPEPVYYGMVNYMSDAYPISLQKKNSEGPKDGESENLIFDDWDI